MSKIPNIITSLRIILSLVLLFFCHEVTPFFICIFLIAMLTDFLDGFLARKLGACSENGAMLDTVADLLLDANLIKIVFTMRVMTQALTTWMITALCVGAISPIINFIKHKKLFFIHSLPCKACMWALLGIPFAIHYGFISIYLVFTLSLISFAMVELVILSIILNSPDPDAKSVYSVIKENKKAKI